MHNFHYLAPLYFFISLLDQLLSSFILLLQLLEFQLLILDFILDEHLHLHFLMVEEVVAAV